MRGALPAEQAARWIDVLMFAAPVLLALAVVLFVIAYRRRP